MNSMSAPVNSGSLDGTNIGGMKQCKPIVLLGVCALQNALFLFWCHTVDGSELPNNHLGWDFNYRSLNW